MNTADTCGGTFVAGACPGDSTIKVCPLSMVWLSIPASSKHSSVLRFRQHSTSTPNWIWHRHRQRRSQRRRSSLRLGRRWVLWSLQRRFRLLRSLPLPTISTLRAHLPIGLTQYSVCQALQKTIPRTAQTQYHSTMGRHLPRADAQAGDMIFWATNGDCANSVAHVGIFMRPGWMVNAAHTGTPVREQSIWISSGGESICPDAVRYVDLRFEGNAETDILIGSGDW